MSLLLSTFRTLADALTYVPRRIYRVFVPAQPEAVPEQPPEPPQPEEERQGRIFSAYNDEINEHIQHKTDTVTAYVVIRNIHAEFNPDQELVYVDFHYLRGGIVTVRLFGTYAGISGVGMLRAAMTSVDNMTEEERKEQTAKYRPVIEMDQITAAYVYKPADNRQRIPNRVGGQYKYFNGTKIDLSRYDIYTEEQASDPKYRQHNCLYIALSHTDLEEEVLDYLKINFFKHEYTTTKDLPVLAQMINRQITLHYYTRDRSRPSGICKKAKVFGSPDHDNIDIAYYNNHFFIYERTVIKKYAAVNYEQVQHLPNFNEIAALRSDRPGKYRTDSRAPYLMSLNLVIILSQKKLINIENPFLNVDTPKTQLRGEDLNIERALETDVGEDFKFNIYLKRINRLNRESKTPIFYADTETYVTGERHELLAIGFMHEADDEPTIYRTLNNDPKSAVYNMLDRVPDRSIIYFHNLKYDFSIISNCLTVATACETNGNLYSVKIHHRGKKIELRDSYKIITMGLGKFGKTFNIPSKKDCIAYDYYTKENQDELVHPDIYWASLSKEDREIFDPTGYMKDGLFDPYKYYMDYLKQDVMVLKAGMEKFNEHLQKIDPALSVHDYLTIGSIALSASYNDLSKFTPVKNTLRAFFNSCYTGGDVQVNEKFRKVKITDKIVDIDAVSLYPSAMIRAGNEGWFNTGEPEYRTDEWEKYSTYMNVRITKVNRKIQPPLLCYRDHKNGNKHDYDTEGRIYQLHSILLKTYIDMLDIEYEIIDGIQFRGPPIKFNAIETFFNERLKAKKEGNSGLSTVLKLIMNSTYGKTIEKQRFDENVFIKSKDLDTFKLNNYAYFKSSRQYGHNTHCVSMKKIDQSYGIPYVGATILAMAKRIMFEVREAIHDSGGDLLYTDTDSLHMKQSDFLKANELYTAKYGKSLDDKSGLPGTFHNDLPNNAEYAEEAYFFGKKSYAHKINGKWHVTMKGITGKGIEYIRKKGDIERDLLIPLSKGEPVKILMNPPGFAPSFEIEMDNVTFKSDFYRTVKF